jgi:hypothetical protein
MPVYRPWRPIGLREVKAPTLALGQVFSEYFGFSYKSSFHQFLHNHHLEPVLAAVPKVPQHKIKIKLKGSHIP